MLAQPQIYPSGGLKAPLVEPSMEETLSPPHCLEMGHTMLRPYLDSKHSWEPRGEKTTTLSSSKLLKLGNWLNETISSYPLHCCLAAVSMPRQSPKHRNRQPAINPHHLPPKAFKNPSLSGRMRKSRPWTMPQNIGVTKTSFLGSGSDRVMAFSPQQTLKRNWFHHNLPDMKKLEGKC